MEPTKITKTTGLPENQQVTEYNSIHSVELTQSAKGEWRVSTVKVYDSDPTVAAERVVMVAEDADRYLMKSRLTDGKDEGKP